jgi:hypothetical protein
MAKMSVRTFFKKNELPALMKRLDLEKNKSFVTIGIHEGEGSVDKKTSDNEDSKLLLIDVANFHEFGTPTVPQRSFIRANDKINYQKYKKMIAEIKDKVIFEKMSMIQGLGLLGEQIRLDIQARIRSGIKPALLTATIRRKGSSVPLIDTGQLVNGITYKVGGTK